MPENPTPADYRQLLLTKEQLDHTIEFMKSVLPASRVMLVTGYALVRLSKDNLTAGVRPLSGVRPSEGYFEIIRTINMDLTQIPFWPSNPDTTAFEAKFGHQILSVDLPPVPENKADAMLRLTLKYRNQESILFGDSMHLRFCRDFHMDKDFDEQIESFGRAIEDIYNTLFASEG